MRKETHTGNIFHITLSTAIVNPDRRDNYNDILQCTTHGGTIFIDKKTLPVITGNISTVKHIFASFWLQPRAITVNNTLSISPADYIDAFSDTAAICVVG